MKVEKIVTIALSRAGGSALSPGTEETRRLAGMGKNGKTAWIKIKSGRNL
jgi:hypothetical protein